MTFDHDLGVKVTQNVVQYLLHYVSYAATKFEDARSNSLGGDTFTRNVTVAQTHGQTDRLWYEINIPVFSKEKSGYNYKSPMHDMYVRNLFHV